MCSPNQTHHWMRLMDIATATHERLQMFGGWTILAAGSLVGIEALEIIFGFTVVAPEFVPLVLLTLAIAWLFRKHLRRVRVRLGARYRLRRIHRVR